LCLRVLAERTGSVSKLRIFYHVFKGDEQTSAANIVKEQMSNLQNLAPNSFEVDFTTVGTTWDLALINASNLNCSTCYHSTHKPEGWEPLTQQRLYEYCVQNPSKQVAYIHNKGSFHDWPENARLRRFVMKGITSEECMKMPATCDVCASRWTPLPHPHAPGNMWHAKCSHIRRLQPPVSFQQQMNDFFQAHMSASPWTESVFHRAYNGIDRASSEHWVLSHPDTEPCGLHIYPFVNGHAVPGDAPGQAGPLLPKLQVGMRWPLWKYMSGWPSDPKQLIAWVQWRCMEWRTLYKKLPTDFSKWRFEEALHAMGGVKLEALNGCNGEAPAVPVVPAS